jgi:hypothetical protein
MLTLQRNLFKGSVSLLLVTFMCNVGTMISALYPVCKKQDPSDVRLSQGQDYLQ